MRSMNGGEVEAGSNHSASRLVMVRCLPSRDCGMAGKTQKDCGSKSCSILTTTPNVVTSQVHDRMPVILNKGDYDVWLDPGMTNVDAISELLKPLDACVMRLYLVSSRINRVQNDDEE